MAASISRCTPTASMSATMCRHLIAFSTVLLFLAPADYYRYFLVDASTGASHGPRLAGSNLLLGEYDRHGGRDLKAQAAENFHFAAAGASFRKSRRASTATSFTSQRRQTSNVEDDENARSRLEVETLTALKAAITSDPLGILKSWRANDSDVCGWTGVVCAPQHPKALVGLNLGGRQLVGHLNSALQKIGNLPFLRRLDLSDNVFSGSIPGAALANCSSLSYFNLSYNQVSGPIPFLLGELINLAVLDFERNNLSGEIPATLGNCTLLKVLDLGSNLLEGDIPPELGRLSSLEFLNLGAKLPDPSSQSRFLDLPAGLTSFSGSLPLALGNCSSLAYLDVTYNSHLGGNLSPELTSLKSLQQLWLAFCSFQGALPIWLGNSSSLSVLRLSYNQFYGEIPAVLGELRDLHTLTLGGNNLSGGIPISITNCTRLTKLALEKNYLLGGHIPPQLGLLKNLEILALGENDFTGVIPPETANCSALTDLDFGYNPMDSQIIPSWMGSLANLSYLYLGKMSLQGGIPQELGKLSNLQYLILFSNNLSGVVPHFLENFTSLITLDLADNQLQGEVPFEIGLLINVEYVDFSFNYLTGSLPASIGNLTQVESLIMSSNSLNGTINAYVGRLSKLQNFHADDNNFGGQIPVALSNCSNFFEIVISRNGLTGEIPASIGNLTRLERLLLDSNEIGGMVPVDILRCSKLGLVNLEFNNLEGEILINIGELSSLRELHLADNRFFGVVPSSLGNCSDMSSLDLSYNRLIGDVPGDVFGNMSSLTFLNVSHNFFSGSWPQQLSELTNLQIIDISSNNISGSLPSSLVNCKPLVKLDISINNLTGGIPPSLGLLSALAFFNASYNGFEGPIPDSGVFKANLTEASFKGNPGLCGSILGPHRECLALSGTHNATSHRSCEGFSCKRVWIPTTCAGAGFVFIIAAVLYWMNTHVHREAKRRNNSTNIMLNFGPQIRFSEKDVLRTIDGDKPGENVIGIGAKSVVYKGEGLHGGEMFAIKVLQNYHGPNENADSSQRDSELLQEVNILAQLRHRNILKVLGVCSTSVVRAIILEYMPQGSLHEHLHPLDGNICELTWQSRFSIAFGTAEGMMYLHHDFPEPLIHRDLKPSNILLDANLNPKISDFGISKFASRGGEGEATASKVCGTIGYMPPEYATGASLSTKGDVYSYGIVLLELVTTKLPTSDFADNFGPGRDLRGWVIELFQKAPIELLDSSLLHESAPDSVKKRQMMLLIRLALFCTRETPQSRPSMTDVLAMLMQIKEVGVSPVIRRTIEELANDHGSPTWTSEDPNSSSLPSIEANYSGSNC